MANEAGYGQPASYVVSPSTKDRTGEAPYSMANRGKKVRTQTIPNTFVREPFLR